MILVPPQQLSPEALEALIEEFVTRDGAVQGHSEMPVETRIAAVRRQLGAGEAAILFDEENESCTIISRQELNARSHALRRIVPDE